MHYTVGSQGGLGTRSPQGTSTYVRACDSINPALYTTPNGLVSHSTIAHNSVMELMEAIKTSHLSIIAAGLLAVLIAVTMGLFGRNQMPVDGKVSKLLPPFCTLHERARRC